MKHPVELAAAIDNATRLARRAYDLNDGGLNRSPQHLVGGSLFQHALDIADATVILVRKGLPGPALALARPLVESWLRGVWATKCANDLEIGKFLDTGRPGPWRLEELSESIKERIPTDAKWLEETTGQPEVRSMLHDFTHGGSRQVQYRFGGETIGSIQSIESMVPIKLQVALLQLGNEIREKCVTQLCEIMNDETLLKADETP